MEYELNSRSVLSKPEWSSVRALYKGMGLSDYDLDDRPLIGIFNTFNTGNPGHYNLRQVSEFVIRGILQNGGTPVEIGTIGPCDGMGCGNSGMRYILPSRELISDSIESISMLHHFDGVVLLGSCDKVIPGLLMAAARIDIPALLVNGGPALGGILFDGRESDNSTMVEALSMLKRGEITANTFDILEDCSNPTCGSCSFLGTANTMCAVAEAMGMMLPGSSMVPAVYAERLRVAEKSGRLIVDMVRNGLNARRIINTKSIENALRLGMAIGGSTNMALHFPAIADEAGLKLDVNQIDKLGRTTPQIALVYPNGKYNVPKFYKAGGVLAVMKQLEPLLNEDAIVCTGQYIFQVLEDIPKVENCVIHSLEKPFNKVGSLAAVKGNLAPDGGITKPTAINPNMLKFVGKAKCFNSEEEATKAVDDQKIEDGTVVIIRYQGPKGGPGMPEMVRIMKKLYGQNKAMTTAVVTDGRFSGSNNGCFVGHVSPEAAAGGPIALVHDGDTITIDIPNGILSMDVSEDELARRKKLFIPKSTNVSKGYLSRYVELVHSAVGGALLHD